MEFLISDDNGGIMILILMGFLVTYGLTFAVADRCNMSIEKAAKLVQIATVIFWVTIGVGYLVGFEAEINLLWPF